MERAHGQRLPATLTCPAALALVALCAIRWAVALDLNDNLAVEANYEADNLVNSWLANGETPVGEPLIGEPPEQRAHNSDNLNNQLQDDFIDQDEERFILSGARPIAPLGRIASGAPTPRKPDEIYLLEDKDYPKSLFEDYSRRVGQVSGVSALPSGDLVIFHRAERQWNGTTNEQMLALLASANQSAADKQRSGNQHLIANDTLMLIGRDDGASLATFGAGLFFMPHSCASDRRGNVWVSDVGRHQVMRLPTGRLFGGELGGGDGGAAAAAAAAAKLEPGELGRKLRTVWPDLVLGEAFVAGADEHHFCQPSEIALSSDGRLVYVADGYCNQRVMVFTGEGKLLKWFGEAQQMGVVHSLTLLEEHDLICVADRENARIHCYSAGLAPGASGTASGGAAASDDNNDDDDADRSPLARLAQLGRLQLSVQYPIGRVFAIQAIGRDHLLVSSQQFGASRYDLAILNPFTEELKLVWTSSDLLEPHSLTRTFDGQFAYAADVSHDAAKKLFKFEIIQRTGG